MVDLFQIPEPDKAEVWHDVEHNRWYVVYYVPDTDIPMLYHMGGADLSAVFGPDQKPVADWETTGSNINRTGATLWGEVSELSNQTEHPFLAWTSTVSDQASVRPWLRDDEVLALIASAMLEGRSVTSAEFQQTDWWRTHNDAQRQWMLVVESDPMTAEQMIGDARLQVTDLLQRAGIDDPPADLVNYMADRWTTGDWTQLYTQAQIRALSDPQAGIALDDGLADFAVGSTTQDRTEDVRSLVSRWLGPVFGDWSDRQVAEWAGILRNQDDGEDQLIDMLRNQRLAVLPGYSNPNLTYDDIASPWRGFVQSIWGQTADETDSVFTRILNMNDSTEAGKLLRSEGLKRGIGKVSNDLRLSLLDAFGGQVRRAV